MRRRKMLLLGLGLDESSLDGTGDSIPHEVVPI